ncbi:MAG: hypothetical protein AAF125_03685, partial [Chloroflexota bacterium]
IWVLFSWEPIPVSACGGGPPSWDEWLPSLVEDAEVIVFGRYTDLDDAEANGIFQVESYFHGHGPRDLLIQATDPRIIENNVNVQRYFASCGWYTQLRLHKTGHYIYFLQRQVTGAYDIRHSRYFAHDGATVKVGYRTPESQNSGVTILEDLTAHDIQQQIAQINQQQPPDPVDNLSRLRTAPILFQVTDGRFMMLPVDTNTPVPLTLQEVDSLRRDRHLCSGPPCTAYSPNGLDFVQLVAEGDEWYSSNWGPFAISQTVGERVAFSTTSETYALWVNDEIRIFLLWYPGMTDTGPGPTRNYLTDVQLVNTTEARDSLNYPTVWHPDGRQLVFSTSQGLWLWDALTTDFPPQLVLQDIETVPTARYFSPRGRYLAVTVGDRHYTLDLLTGQELPDGYVSPNDRILLAFDTNTSEPTTLDIVRLAPGIDRQPYYPEVTYRQVQWINNTRFIASISGFGHIEYTTGEQVYLDPSTGEQAWEAIPNLVEESFVEVRTYHISGASNLENNKIPYSLGYGPQTDRFIYAAGPGQIEVSEEDRELIVNGSVISL